MKFKSLAKTSNKPLAISVQGWFDDRVEVRNALSKLPYLYSIKGLDRKELPWTTYPEDRPQRATRATSRK